MANWLMGMLDGWAVRNGSVKYQKTTQGDPSSLQKFHNPFLQHFSLLDLTLPYNDGPPSCCLEHFLILCIPLFVPFDFRQPIICVRFRLLRPCLAVVAMPKTAMHEDDHFSTNESNVWLTWDIFAVQAITVVAEFATNLS